MPRFPVRVRAGPPFTIKTMNETTAPTEQLSSREWEDMRLNAMQDAMAECLGWTKLKWTEETMGKR